MASLSGVRCIPFSGTHHPISWTPGLSNSAYFTPTATTHRRTRDPVRCPIDKSMRARLVVGSVTTSESLVLYVFCFVFRMLLARQTSRLTGYAVPSPAAALLHPEKWPSRVPVSLDWLTQTCRASDPHSHFFGSSFGLLSLVLAGHLTGSDRAVPMTCRQPTKKMTSERWSVRYGNIEDNSPDGLLKLQESIRASSTHRLYSFT